MPSRSWSLLEGTAANDTVSHGQLFGLSQGRSPRRKSKPPTSLRRVPRQQSGLAALSHVRSSVEIV